MTSSSAHLLFRKATVSGILQGGSNGTVRFLQGTGGNPGDLSYLLQLRHGMSVHGHEPPTFYQLASVREVVLSCNERHYAPHAACCARLVMCNERNMAITLSECQACQTRRAAVTLLLQRREIDTDSWDVSDMFARFCVWSRLGHVNMIQSC